MRGYAFYGFIKEDETRAPFMEHLGPYYYQLAYEKKRKTIANVICIFFHPSKEKMRILYRGQVLPEKPTIHIRRWERTRFTCLEIAMCMRTYNMCC